MKPTVTNNNQAQGTERIVNIFSPNERKLLPKSFENFMSAGEDTIVY